MWSAAAANGEEPYSLAMELTEVFRRPDPPATILATDIDEDALTVAECGEYSELALRALDPRRRARFFSQAGVVGRWRIAPELRRWLEFRVLNLADVSWPVEGPFDVIFCRNVLMYLEECHRYAVLERIASLLASDGMLLLDPAEHLGTAGQWFSQEVGGVYLRRETAAPRRDRGRASACRGQIR